MKKHLSFIVMLVILLAMFNLANALTVTVGADATQTSSYLPIYTLYGYNYTQQIYTQAQINTAGSISKIRFFRQSGGAFDNCRDWVIYMGHSTRSTFDSTTDWEPVSNLTQVFEGDTFAYFPEAGQWMEIPLDTPFEYNNVDNLIIAIDENTPSYSSTVTWGAFASGTNTGIYYYNDSTNPDPTSPPAASNRSGTIARLQLVFPDTEAPMAPLLVSPENGAQIMSGQSLSWTLPVGSADASGYDLYIDDTIVSNDQPGTSYTISDIGVGNHTWHVVANNNIGSSAPSETRTFEIVNGVIIGTGTANQQDPFNAWYGHGRSLGLYTMDEIGQLGVVTTVGWSVATANTATIPYKIYAKLTDDTALTSMTWDAFTSTAIIVKEGSYTFDSTGWHSFLLDTPITFTGGNLLIGVEANYGGTGASGQYPYFHYTTSAAGTHQKWQADNNPPTTTGTMNTNRPNLLLMLSALSDDPTFNIYPTVADMGIVLLDTTAEHIFTIRNVGGGSLGINSISISGNDFFTLENMPTLPASLSVGQPLSFTVSYSPTQPGIHDATITVNDDRSTHTATITATCIDTNITELPYFQDFDSVTVPNLPLDWGSLITTGGSSPVVVTYASAPNSTPNCVRIYNGSPAAPNTMLIAPPMSFDIPVNTVRMKIWVKGVGAAYGLSFGVLTDPLDPSTYTEIQSITTPTAWTEFVVPFNGYTGDGRFITIKHSNLAAGQTIYIDDVTFELMGDNDLAVIELTGNQTPSAESPTTYTAHVFNWGTLAQDSYTVGLYDLDNNELAITAGLAVAPGQTVEVPMSWTPPQPGNMSIYAKTNLPTDQNPSNDQSPTMALAIQAPGALVVTVGSGTSVNTTTGVPTPYGTYYKNFRQQYLYKADELYASGAAPGMITAVAFEVQNVNNCSAMPNYTMRVKHTQQTQLSTTFETGDYTEVFFEDNFQPSNGWNTHPFDAPFVWNGVDNILIDVFTTLIPGTYTQNASVYYTATTGTNTSLRYQSDSVDAGTYATGTVSVNRANVRLFLNVSGMGTLNGTVTSDGVAVPGVNVEISNTIHHTITDALGHYTFPYVDPGTYTVTASKLGFEAMSLPATIVEDETTTLDFDLTASSSVTLTGFVAGSDQPTVGLEEAQVSFTGIMNYHAETDATGHFTIPGVLSGNTYNYVITCEGYSELTGSVTIGNENHDMGTLILDEIAFPPSNVIAEENLAQTQVSLIWNTPIPNPPFDDFEQNDGGWIPTASWSPVGDWEWTDSYDIANWSPEYTGTSVIPPQTAYSGTGMWGTKINTNYTNSGGSNYLSKTFNFAGIQNPEIRWWSWENVFGDFDYCQLKVNGSIVWGPSWEYTNTQWQERVVNLNAYAGNSNVEIQFEMYATTVVNYAGWYIDDVYVGTALDRSVSSAPSITPSWMQGLDKLTAAAKAEELAVLNPVRSAASTREPQRVITGYKVWRLLNEDHDNENLWTLLTLSTITDTTYVDTAWEPLPSGVYKYAVKTVYTNDVLSTPAFSNEIHKGMMGTISGTVTEFGTDLPINGATITAGDYSGTSAADGSYAFLAYQDTYNVTCAKNGYQNAIHPGIMVVGQQTTTLDITLTEITLPPMDVQAVEEGPASVSITWMSPTGDVDPGAPFNDGFESYPDFELSFDPWVLVDVDNSATYGITDYSWPNVYSPMAFMIFNPNTTTPPLTSLTAHSGDKMAACFASTQAVNNDWMITPVISPQAGQEFKFWAKSYTDTYGMERFKVGVSNGGTAPAYFTIISGTSYLEAPVNWTQYSYDLSSYAGQSIRLAINCVSDDAFFFLVDDVSVGAATVASLSPNPNKTNDNALTRSTGSTQRNFNSYKIFADGYRETSAQTRALLGYRVWRLNQGEEGNENLWVSLTQEPITETNLVDDAWQGLVDGSYRWAVKAVYTGGALSPAAISNPLTKITYIGTIAGIVRSTQNAPIQGVTVSCGDLSATTNNSGAYSLQIEAGVYDVTANHPNYQSVTFENVTVYANQTTTQNFQLSPLDGDDNSLAPVATSLNGNYPNPFNPETTISFSLKEPAKVAINIYNIQGKLVKTLVNEERTAGHYTVIWNGKDSNGRNVASGVYYYRMTAGKYSNTRKMIMLK